MTIDKKERNRRRSVRQGMLNKARAEQGQVLAGTHHERMWQQTNPLGWFAQCVGGATQNISNLAASFDRDPWDAFEIACEESERFGTMIENGRVRNMTRELQGAVFRRLHMEKHGRAPDQWPDRKLKDVRGEYTVERRVVPFGALQVHAQLIAVGVPEEHLCVPRKGFTRLKVYDEDGNEYWSEYTPTTVVRSDFVLARAARSTRRTAVHGRAAT